MEQEFLDRAEVRAVLQLWAARILSTNNTNAVCEHGFEMFFGSGYQDAVVQGQPTYQESRTKPSCCMWRERRCIRFSMADSGLSVFT
jgi:hypothetical protein